MRTAEAVPTSSAVIQKAISDAYDNGTADPVKELKFREVAKRRLEDGWVAFVIDHRAPRSEASAVHPTQSDAEISACSAQHLHVAE